jgi:putative two-component system response regulator
MNIVRPPVLLVENDASLLERFGMCLESQGFDVELARTARDAIRALGARRFDAVVSDVDFDGQPEGHQVLQAARELQPCAIVLLLSDHPEVEDAVSAMKLGAYEYLQKPIDPRLLANCVQRGIKERELASPALEFGELAEILSFMVAQSIERVDPYTAGHSERTRLYARTLARKIGVDAPSLERLELAAIAHDYGKIHLENLSFLTKTSSLTASEYRDVQRHPLLGAQKLGGGNPRLREVCRYIAEHHERWDGTGYPRRLKGDEISLPGRILGVVEVFDSLSTKRSYKEVWELSRTIEFFSAQRGRAFDPDVLDVFVSLMEAHGEAWMRASELESSAGAAQRSPALEQRTQASHR